MRLAHLKRQPLVESIPKQEAMDKPGVHAGNAHHAAAANGSDTLTQRFAAAAFNFKVAEDRLRGAAFGFKPDRVNDGIDTPLPGGLLNNFFRRIVIIIEVDGNGTVTRLGKPQPVGVMVNNKDLLSP